MNTKLIFYCLLILSNSDFGTLKMGHIKMYHYVQLNLGNHAVYDQSPLSLLILVLTWYEINSGIHKV